MKQSFILSLVLGAMSIAGLLGATKLRRLPQAELEDCRTSDRSQQFTIQGQAEIECWKDKGSVIKLAGVTQPVAISFSNPGGKVLRFASQTDGEAALQVSDSAGEVISHGYVAPSIKEGLAPATMNFYLPPGKEKIIVQKNGPGAARIFNLSIVDASGGPIPTTSEQHLSREKIPWISLSIVSLALGTLIFLYPLARHIHIIRPQWLYWLSVLVCAYAVLYFIEGLPFLTSMGFYDPFDDKSYLEWAHRIGFHQSLDISQGTSAAARQNVHTWGTGLILSPPFLIARLLMPGGSGFEPVVFTLLTSWSVVLGLSTLIIFYYGFSLVFESWIAALISFATLAGTSMTKWTFGRLIFSHAPEALSLALGLLFFIQIYVKNRTKLAYYLGLAFSLWLTIQIRRENILVAIIPLYFEVIHRRPRAFVLLAITACLSILTLQGTNAFTQLESIRASVPTAGTIVLEWNKLKQDFWLVLAGQKVGFFTTGVFVPLSMLSIFFFRRKIHLLIPFIALSLSYLLMCMLHAYPTGIEWQNRFLLKLNPIIFAGIGIFLQRSGPRMRWISVTIMVIGFYLQHQLYLENLHPNQAVFADLYPDLVFTHPATFRPERYLLLPLRIVCSIAAMTVLGLFAFLYLERRKISKSTRGSLKSEKNALSRQVDQIS